MQADGFNRRTRHLNIAMLFLQKLIRRKLMCLEWTPGQHQLGDVLTKVLDKSQSTFLREQLGFRELTPSEAWQASSSRKKPNSEKPKPLKELVFEKLSKDFVDFETCFRSCVQLMKGGHKLMVILELCTNVGSGFAPAHGRKFRGLSAFVIQCTREHDLVQSTSVLIDGVRRLRSRGCKTYVHFSPPCTGGSPMQYLQKDKLEERLSKYWKDFEKLLDCADRIFREAHTCSVELSRACRYWKTTQMQKFLNKHNLQLCTIDVHIRMKNNLDQLQSIPIGATSNTLSSQNDIVDVANINHCLIRT